MIFQTLQRRLKTSNEMWKPGRSPQVTSDDDFGHLWLSIDDVVLPMGGDLNVALGSGLDLEELTALRWTAEVAASPWDLRAVSGYLTFLEPCVIGERNPSQSI